MAWNYILTIFVGALLGGAIGLEREYRAKEAGFRTHFLVGLGSALFMVLSMHGFDGFEGQAGVIIQRDPARMAAQVVSGIGFIGAGTIIFQKNVVKGLTTAAGLWASTLKRKYLHWRTSICSIFLVAIQRSIWRRW